LTDDPIESARPSWRTVSTLEEPNLAQIISERIAVTWGNQSETLSALRISPTLLMFSDYSGTHKGAQFDIYTFLVTTTAALRPFLAATDDLRAGAFGRTRRMSYKSLNDTVRARALPEFLTAANQMQGLVVSFAIDKRAAHRLSEEYQPTTVFGSLGTWSPRSFRKLTTVGNLASILVEGVRGELQNLMWFTDSDDIAPNEPKHREATQVLGHQLSVYLTGQMGHLRFGTSASDPGDLSIEDSLAVPDLAAGCLGEVLAHLATGPGGDPVERLFVPEAGHPAPKVRRIAGWLSEAETALQKVNVIVNEGSPGCSVHTLTLFTDVHGF
jgi:hypothetical protein